MTPRLSMNSCEPCGSATARRRHTALAEHCDRCGTPGRRMPRLTLAEIVERRRQQRATWDAA